MENSTQNYPENGIKADETVVRLIAAQVVILISIAAIGQNFILSAFIALDFASRAFGYSQFSLLKTIAKGIKSSLKLKSKMTDEAPKKFAAAVGFFVISTLAISQVGHWIFTAASLGGMIITFAALESIPGVCIACMLYNTFSRFREVN